MKAYGFAIVLTIVLSSALLRADSYIYDISVPNSELAAYNSFGTASVNLINSNTATVTFAPNSGYLLGGQGVVNLNVNAGSWSSSATGSQLPGFSSASIDNNGSGDVSSFGTFNQTFKITGGFTKTFNEVVVSLTNLSGIWGSSAEVLSSNSQGYTLSGHIFVCEGSCQANSGAAVTGYAANGSGIIAPEPSTYLLFGSMLSLIYLIRLIRQSRVKARVHSK